MKSKLLSIILAMFLLFIPNALSAMDVSSNVLFQTNNYTIEKVVTPHSTRIVFNGAFSQGSGISLAILLNSAEFDTLVLNSPGGFVSQGYIAANIIKSKNISVEVETNGYCISTCSLLAMASPDLTLNGFIAIHTPYLRYVPTSDTLDDTFKKSNKTVLRYTTFLLENGYSLQLVNKIYKITDSKTFMVFENIENINSLKVKNVLKKSDKFDTLYEIEDINGIKKRMDK